MATVAPPPSKRQKVVAENRKREEEESKRIPKDLGSVRVQFKDQSTGQFTGVPVSLLVDQANIQNLEHVLNTLKGQSDDERTPYRFTFQPQKNDLKSFESALDVTFDLYNSIIKPQLRSTEDIIILEYIPQTIFKIQAVTRCSSSISGHEKAILATQFSPISSSRMVTGSGDGTARIWDCDTGTPFKTLKGHKSWILAVSYSPDGKTIATGSMDNTVRTWDANTGRQLSESFKGHTKWITSLAWEPYHLQKDGQPRLASASKDASIRLWFTGSGKTDIHFTQHRDTVSCVKWGGTGNIFSSSHDRTVKIWNSWTGQLLQNLTAHSHWVNHIALSTDFTNRTGFYEPNEPIPQNEMDKQHAALQRFKKASTINGKTMERLVTASDDCTVYLWDTNSLSTPIKQLTGHQKQVNHVTFSPDGQYIASCGFDNHVKLWHARDGSFHKTLRGHVAPVYQCCFSSDSRLLVSSSKDTTLKVWDVRTAKLLEDLPGHQDEVFAVDWSPDGKRVGSGGKDKNVRIWTH